MRLFLISPFFLSLCFLAFDKPTVKPCWKTTELPSAKPRKPLVLASLEAISVQNPSANYATEWRDALKQNATISNQQAEHKKFWARDFLLRLNQLTRDLVAAHNVPPRVLPDSSGYGVPNPQNPSALPRYPFANPPYAARVFAYVSVAQYDALLVALHYQDKFKETTPSVSDDKKPSYPSEEAAALMSTLDVLKAFFPAEEAYINERGATIRQTLLQNKKYVLSDIVAGEQIGQQVAAKVLARAQADGMSETRSTPLNLSNILQNRPNLGELTWQSRQKPARPTIEPHFGTVKAWFFQNVADYRPSSPPSVNSDSLAHEIETVKRYMHQVDKPKMLTVVKWADPEFTATPIGHWNAIACDLLAAKHEGLLEQAHVLALLNMALMDATIVCWEAKTYYFYPRPSQVDATLRPLIPLPNFPSYPSGHSTFSSTAATVLTHFFPESEKKLWEMAQEASDSRIHAGLHFKMDCTAGTEIGKKMGRLAVEKTQ